MATKLEVLDRAETTNTEAVLGQGMSSGLRNTTCHVNCFKEGWCQANEAPKSEYSEREL